MNVPFALVVGIVIGIVVAIAAMVLMMRSQMVVPERSGKGFEETCRAIEEVVPGADGWSFPMESFDMSAKLAAKNGLPDNLSRVKLYFMCNPEIAKRVLGAQPKLSAIMPCSWSVYEREDGSVWVSHMNIGLMARMMGGVVGESMGTVAEVDRRFLESVLH